MGNKVPLFDLWSNNYRSRWMSLNRKEYADNVVEDIKLRELLHKLSRNHRWGLSDAIITRVGQKINLMLVAVRPGIIMGKSGVNLDNTKQLLKKITDKDIEIDVRPIEKVESDSTAIAFKLIGDLRSRKSCAAAMRKYADEAMKFGIKGIRIECAGRLGGVEIARRAVVCRGSVPRHRIKANISYVCETAYTSSGTCGVKVWVHTGNTRKKLDEKRDYNRYNNNRRSEKGRQS